MQELNNPKKESNKKRTYLIGGFILLSTVFLAKIYTDFEKRDRLEANFLLNPRLAATEVLGEENASAEVVQEEEVLASSENFNIEQINLTNGENLSDIFGDFEGGGLLTVNNVKSELYSIKDGDKSEVKAIISCQTNKRTTMEVEYLKSGEKKARIAEDSYLSSNHMVVIPALEEDSVYRYSVNVKDQNGNKTSSEQFVFYTGAPNLSLIDILGNAVQKVFGWAIRK